MFYVVVSIFWQRNLVINGGKLRHKNQLSIIKCPMKNKENFVISLKDVLGATLISLLSSLLFVLLFALIIRWADLDEKVIVPVNYAIKFLSIFLGVMIMFKDNKNGILKGLIAGAVFMLLSFLIFNAMDGFKSVNFNWIDLIFIPAGGAISGIIKVNIPSRRK